MRMYDAINIGDLNAVQQIIAQDPSKLDEVCTTSGATPLRLACTEIFKHEHIAKWLIQKGAKLDLVQPDGWSALIYSCQHHQCATAQLLVETGANLGFVDNGGWSALMYACYCDQPETARLLIQKGAKLDLVTRTGWSALMLACRHDQPATAQLLIQNGAKLDLVEKHGWWSALMYACRYGQSETVRLLIHKGAKLDFVNNDGMSALMLACMNPFESGTASGMLKCLEHCYIGGANCELVVSRHLDYKRGSTALDIARKNGRFDAVEFLEYVSNNPVVILLQNDLKGDRAIVVHFYSHGIHTLDDCKLLEDSDLKEIGMTKVMQRKKFLHHMHQKQKSGIIKRISQRFTNRISGVFSYEAFLTHDWGIDELGRDNHLRVSNLNKALQAKGIKTWFDEEELEEDIVQKMEKGVSSSHTVVVFVTERYMHKLNKIDEDNCKNVFITATTARGVRNMIFVVMEPRMRDQSKWIGPLVFEAGTQEFISYVDDSQSSVDELAKRIKALVSN